MSDQAENPDAELIRRCRAYQDAWTTYERLGGRDDDENDRLWDLLTAAEEHARALRPVTLAGLAAVAEVARMQAVRRDDGSLDYSDSYCRDWPAMVVEGVLRLTPASPA